MDIDKKAGRSRDMAPAFYIRMAGGAKPPLFLADILLP